MNSFKEKAFELTEIGSLTAPKSYYEFSEVASKFGTKAAGLMYLPSAWTPPYFAICKNVHAHWREHGELPISIEAKIFSWLERNSGSAEIIVRSSGTKENIDDRGKYKSIKPKDCTLKGVLRAMNAVYECARTVDELEEMGLVLQCFETPDSAGHLSNETRVSPTRNQWKYETENPFAPASGISCTSAPLPDPAMQFAPGKQLHQTFRSIGKWCSENIPPRCHLEWVQSGDNLWLVQLDFEWHDQDDGIDPTRSPSRPEHNFPDLESQNALTLYNIGDETKWHKLRNLEDFDFGKNHPAPRIFQLSASRVLQLCADKRSADSLVEEVRRLTGDRAVVRTEDQSPNTRPFNQPRTDTVSADVAISWCQDVVRDLTSSGSIIGEIMFLIHAYLPARAAAWAYASPGSEIVKVDALWGFPDGLQVLPTDEYEVVTKRKKMLSPRSTFKPMFLTEDESGKWVYRKVKKSKARSKVLSKSDVIEIARRTKEISNSLNEPAQIMWFCDVPLEYGVGRNIPWFRSREIMPEAPRIEAKYRDHDVKNIYDLENLPLPHCTIRLLPDANLIRDEKFLDSVIEIAKTHNIPVKLEGSILGHIYYRLCQEGVGVTIPNLPKYRKAPEKRVFGKLVRDKIPQNIREGGEEAIEARLQREDAVAALSGKLIEELDELRQANDTKNKTAELSDLLEVIEALAHHLDISWQQVQEAAAAKKERNGGFLEMKVLLETSLPSSRGRVERESLVSLRQISSVITEGETTAIPLSYLMDSVAQNGFKLDSAYSSGNLFISFEDGRIKLTRVPSRSAVQDSAQLELFSEDEGT